MPASWRKALLWSALVALTAPTAQAQFLVGGAVSGLASGQTVTLLLNGGQPLPRSSNGAFVFPGTLSAGQPYLVQVGSQPQLQTCSVSNASGSIVGSDISNVQVNCSNPGVELLVSGPAVPVLPGQSGEARIRLSGSMIAGAQFRLCFREQELTAGVPVIPTGLTGMSCQPSAANSACPAPTNRSVFCLGFSDFADWSLPQTIRIPFTVASGASGNMASALRFESNPPPLLSTQLGKPVPFVAVGGVFAVAPIPPPSLAVLGPPLPLSATQTGVARVQLAGPVISAASFNLCFDPAALQLATAPIPPGLTGLVCSAAQPGGCAVAGLQRINCTGTTATGWSLPQSLEFPLVVQAMPVIGVSVLSFASGPSFTTTGGVLTPATTSGSVLIVSEPLFVDGFEN